MPSQHNSANGPDQYERIVRRIVEGQIRGFLKEHPSIVAAVDWYQPRTDNAETFTNSLAKRIVRDLVCSHSKGRIRAALLTRDLETPSNLTVEVAPAADAAPRGLMTAGADAASTSNHFAPRGDA